MGKRKITRRDLISKTARTSMLAAAAGAMPGLITGCTRQSERGFDMVIKDGTLYDGTTAAPRVADIGIKGNRVVSVGKITTEALRTINAKGLIVSPGFIDCHTHCDLTFKRLGMKRHLARVMPSFKGNYNYLYQGVTTVVTGNCGYGYTDLNEWFDIHRGVGFGANVHHLVPHGDTRLELFGEKQPERLNKEQLEIFKNKVAAEMEKGAAGFSTRLDVPPGSYADTAELIEIGKVVGRYGGLYATHMRDETGTIDRQGKYGVLKSIAEAIEIGRRAGVPVQISHLKIDSPINELKATRLLGLIEMARKEGLDITADQYPYPAGSTDIGTLIPQQYLDSAGIIKEFREGKGRAELKKAIEATFSNLGPEKTLIVYYPGKEEYEGKTLVEIAGMKGKDPADSLIDMGCEKELPMGVFFSQDIRVVRELMPHDYVFTISDGWTIPKDMMKPHPRLYGTFPRKLRTFVFEEKVMGLAAALRSMTSLPAGKFKIKDRGRIATGCFADITVLNPKTIADRSTYTDPHQYAAGIEYVLVNGVMALENGKATGERGGRPLRRA